MYLELIHSGQDLADGAVYLAADPFWTTKIGQSVKALMRAAAIMIVIGAAIKSAKDIAGGKASKAIGLILGAAAAVVFLWQPTLIESVIGLFAGLTEDGVDSFNTVTR